MAGRVGVDRPAHVGGQPRALLRRRYDQGEGAGLGDEVVGDAPVHVDGTGGEPARDVQPVLLGEVHGPLAVTRLPLVEGREQLRAPGGGLAHETSPVLLGVGGRARHRLAPAVRVRPLQLGLCGVAQVEGDLAEDLEAFLGGQGHPGLLDLDGSFRHLGQLLQPGDLLAQPPLSGPQVLQGVRLRVVEDRGDLVEGEAELAVEEDLLEAGEVGVAVEPVTGGAAIAGREEARLVVVMQCTHRHPGESRDLSHGVAHPPALSSAHSLKPDVGGESNPLSPVGTGWGFRGRGRGRRLRWEASPTEAASAEVSWLRSARVRREEYVGPWFPEPRLADPYRVPGAVGGVGRLGFGGGPVRGAERRTRNSPNGSSMPSGKGNSTGFGSSSPRTSTWSATAAARPRNGSRRPQRRERGPCARRERPAVPTNRRPARVTPAPRGIPDATTGSAAPSPAPVWPWRWRSPAPRSS